MQGWLGVRVQFMVKKKRNYKRKKYIRVLKRCVWIIYVYEVIKGRCGHWALSECRRNATLTLKTPSSITLFFPLFFLTS